MGLSTKVVAALSLAVAAAQAQTIGTLLTFTPGLGACGFTNTSSQYVASVSNATFWGYPGATSDPNNNPICGKIATVTYGAVSVTSEVVDYCPSCNATTIQLSAVGFEEFAPVSQGVVSNVIWEIN